MAQLKSTNIIGNLSVTGNILTELVKTNQLQIDDSVKANKIVLTNTDNASQTSLSNPAIRVGNSDTTIHLLIDRDSIMAKGTSTTVGTLNLNESGGLVKIGSGGLETSGSIIISATGKGHYLKDSSGYSYPGVYDNGANLWLGATATAAKHHNGSTYISSGYNGTSGNRSIFVSVPNNTNNNANNYEVFHTNNYGNWAVKLDGSNVTAGKTWRISISGNAATATNATNATNATTAARIKTEAASANSSRHVFFAYDGDAVTSRRIVHDDDFKYNPSTNVLTVGSISGSAAKLTTPRAINGTNFDGSAAITTTKWGTARTISISSTAGTTGTSVNGSANASLVIPKTMTGFTSITSTTFVGALTGNAASASTLTNITSNDLASSTSTKRYVWFSYDNNATGRPAYSPNFTYQTQEGLLRVEKAISLSDKVKLEYVTSTESLDFVFI